MLEEMLTHAGYVLAYILISLFFIRSTLRYYQKRIKELTDQNKALHHIIDNYMETPEMREELQKAI